MGELYHNSIFWVEVERIRPNPFQPRRDFDELKLQDLAESIRQYGVLQPLVVTRKEEQLEDGSIRVEYELIAGERRLRASRLAGLSQVPVIIRAQEDSDQVKLELAIIENLQRDDLNPIERARAFERLVNEFKMRHVDIARKIGRSREYVSNTLRLLTLPEEVQNLLASGKLSEGHTRAILRLNDRPEEQQVFVKEILLKKLTVREAEAIARRMAHETNRPHAQLQITPELIEIERTLTENLGTRVRIEPKETGGKIVINYFSVEDLQGLLEAMRAASPTTLRAAESLSLEKSAGSAQEARSQPEEGGEAVAPAVQAVAAGRDAHSAAATPPAPATPAVQEHAAAREEEEAAYLDDVPPEEARYQEDREEADDAELYAVRNFSI